MVQANIPDDSDGKLAKALRKLEENGTVNSGFVHSATKVQL
jgi:hypothetical protein